MPHALPDLPCYLDGEFTTLPNARISVMDRGFIFGDGVYEVIPFYKQRPFRFAQHMARLDRSLTALRIPNPLAPAAWRTMADRLITTHAATYPPQDADAAQLVYIQVTRGVALRDHAMPTDLTPTVFAMANRMALPTAQQRDQGVACVSADDFRWQKAHIKSVSLLGAVLARQLSVDAGASETVMFRDGFLSEGASSNVWVVKDGRVMGPPRDHLVLEGVRYGLIETLCAEAGIGFSLRRITRDEVRGADELLLSSATREILPVTQLDGAPVGNGRPGPIYAKLHAGYQRAKQESNE